MRRRSVLLGLAGAGIAGFSLVDLSTEGPDEGIVPDPTLPWAGLLRSSPELDQVLEIEGAFPPGLAGTLYRNGPGRYERGGQWRRLLLDGDGYLQSFRIAGGEIRYRSRYVQTARYLDEERAGRLRHASFGTQAPGGAWRNLGGLSLGYAAGVSVVPHAGELLAFDEPGLPYALDPITLATRGPTDLGIGGGVFNAHTKRIGDELMLYGLEYGRFTKLHVASISGGRHRWHRRIQLEEAHVLHDWFVTRRWCVFLLQPLIANAYPFLAGRRSLAGCLEWWPQLGTRVLLLPRDGTGEPVWLEHESLFFLHGVNAFEREREIVLDLITYEHPDVVFGSNLRIANLASGRLDRSMPPSRPHRLRLDPDCRSIQPETLPFADIEMPVVATVGQPHRDAWVIAGSTIAMLFHGVARIRPETGELDRFDFGPTTFLGEPALTGDGHLLVPGYDGARDRSFLALLRADRVADGPLARAWLDGGVHPGFHGAWHVG